MEENQVEQTAEQNVEVQELSKSQLKILYPRPSYRNSKKAIGSRKKPDV